jgi:hypothetical protein
MEPLLDTVKIGYRDTSRFIAADGERIDVANHVLRHPPQLETADMPDPLTMACHRIFSQRLHTKRRPAVSADSNIVASDVAAARQQA